MTLSVREANRQLEQKKRVERIEAARKHGMSLGVSTARNYQLAKADQNKAVAEELYRHWLKKKDKEGRQSKALVTYAQEEAGEAHKTADRVMSDRTARAAAEKQAWEAERRLHQMRASVSHKTSEVEKQIKAARERDINTHRQATRAAEMQRSHALVEQRRHKAEQDALLTGSGIGLVPRSAAQQAADATRPKVQYHNAKDGSGGKAAVTFAVPPHIANDPEYVPPARAAEKARLETKQRKREQHVQKRNALDRAQQNAALNAALEREEDERVSREKQNIKYVMEAAAKQQNMNMPHVSANAKDFQSEEMRKSEMMNRRAHQEFEYTFLQLKNDAPAAKTAGALEKRREQQNAVFYLDVNRDNAHLYEDDDENYEIGFAGRKNREAKKHVPPSAFAGAWWEGDKKQPQDSNPDDDDDDEDPALKKIKRPKLLVTDAIQTAALSDKKK